MHHISRLEASLEAHRASSLGPLLDRWSAPRRILEKEGVGELGGLEPTYRRTDTTVKVREGFPSLLASLRAADSDATPVPWSWGEASTLCPAQPIPPEPSWPFGAGLSGPGLSRIAPLADLRPDST